MTHPYTSLPPQAFWSTGISRTDRARMPGLYTPRLKIHHDTALATAGSCFAQHLTRTLRTSGVTVLDAEPAPDIMPDTIAHRFGYRLFSGRYGNIYTARQMAQLLDEVADGQAEDDYVWHNEGRYRDALRPTVEPDGHDTAADVLLHRDYHLERTSQMLQQADIFVFTLGLTEAWEDRETGRILPLCPGVSGGTFDPDRHHLRVFRHHEVLADLHRIHTTLRRFNPDMALLLTVSPVPMTATASGAHVLAASSLAKSTLRAAAGEFVASTPNTDYFPSYEIITQPGTGGPWFAPNLRSVSHEGVSRAMEIFCAAHGLHTGPDTTSNTAIDPDLTSEDDDLFCDEHLLAAFAK